MTISADRHERHARRLMRSYPPMWRERYGDEFVELLVQDLDERRRVLPVTADVLRGGMVARLREAGIGETALGAAEQPDASMRTLVWSLATGFLVGVAMWSQLAIGWRWEPPNGTAVAVAMVSMSAAVAVLCTLAVLATVPISWAVGRSLTRGNAALFRPVVLTMGSCVLLLIGCRHFAGGWPGTGGHEWNHQGLVPAGVASFGWAATRGLTAYWAHPAALASFPVVEVLWMLASPLALVGLVTGSVRIVRHVELSRRVLRYEITLAVVAVAVTLAFFAGAGLWVLDNGTPGPTGIYRVGMIDVVGLAAMAGACGVAFRAAFRARDALRSSC
ncbi:MAG: hypothetical protein QOD92_3008 [Acidimicrobiaceae bacterium]|jgi:hypothetical protein